MKAKMKKQSSDSVSDKEFHAAIQLFTQYLYVIRDMGSSDCEKNQHNARVMSQNVFY